MDNKMTAEQAPRDGYDLWDKVCAIPSYGFIHSQDNARVLKVRDIGSWIDRDVVLAIVEQAQYELNELRQAITITAHSSFEEALMEIAGMKNLTATPAQFIRHLQLTAANALLAASPEPVAANTERCPECGMLDGHAEGCPEYWIDMPTNLRRQTNTEQHAQQVIADLRAEVEALRKDAARYRWLREGTASGWLPSDEYEPVLVCATPLMSTSWREDVDKAIDAARLRDPCTYPDCKCPFDMGADNKCLRGGSDE